MNVRVFIINSVCIEFFRSSFFFFFFDGFWGWVGARGEGGQKQVHVTDRGVIFRSGRPN